MRIARKRLLDRTVNVRDARLFVIATEGEKTEKSYFETFGNPRIKVVVLPTPEDGMSAASHVLERMDSFSAQFDLGSEDERWLVLDVDRQQRNLSDTCQRAVQKGIFLAVSNPCFEIWLHLHFAEADQSATNCRALEALLRTLLGSYNKSAMDATMFQPNVRDAIERARALDVSPDARWPAFPGTHVYKLAERLIAANNISA